MVGPGAGRCFGRGLIESKALRLGWEAGDGFCLPGFVDNFVDGFTFRRPGQFP